MLTLICSNYLMDVSESKKARKIYPVAVQLFLAKITNNFGEIIEVVGQQQNKIVHFSICLLLCNKPPQNIVA